MNTGASADSSLSHAITATSRAWGLLYTQVLQFHHRVCIHPVAYKTCQRGVQIIADITSFKNFKEPGSVSIFVQMEPVMFVDI